MCRLDVSYQTPSTRIPLHTPLPRTSWCRHQVTRLPTLFTDRQTDTDYGTRWHKPQACKEELQPDVQPDRQTQGAHKAAKRHAALDMAAAAAAAMASQPAYATCLQTQKHTAACPTHTLVIDSCSCPPPLLRTRLPQAQQQHRRHNTHTLHQAHTSWKAHTPYTQAGSITAKLLPPRTTQLNEGVQHVTPAAAADLSISTCSKVGGGGLTGSHTVSDLVPVTATTTA